MKRAVSLLASSFVLVLVTAGSALAQEDYPPVDVAGASGSSGSGGTAFTGGDVTLGAAIALTLLVFGVTALLVTRRRQSRLAS